MTSRMGAWSIDQSARPVDPTTLEDLGRCAATSPDELSRMVDVAGAAFTGNWPGDDRLRHDVMHRWADAITANADGLVESLIRETGKPRSEALKEVAGAADALSYNAGLCRYIGGRAGTLPDGNELHMVRQPVGVAAFIVPWNWPLLLLLRDLAPALAAGTTAVLKPAPQTTLVTQQVMRLGYEAGLPEEVVHTAIGGGEVGDALVRSERVRAVSFTGSTHVGREILRSAAQNFTRPLLELGGKGVAVLFPDADLPHAVETLVRAAYVTSGQMCMACTRIIAHRDVFDDLADAVAAKAATLRVGLPEHKDTEIGPMISPSHASRVMQFIETARSEGSVVSGGEYQAVDGANGSFIQPTVVTGLAPSSPVVQADVFGPVLSVESFASEEEAITLANATSYGLAAAVWTRNLERSWRMAARIDAGTVWINGYGASSAEMPSGGFKSSGMGRTRGLEGVEQFTELKSVHFGF